MRVGRATINREGMDKLNDILEKHGWNWFQFGNLQMIRIKELRLRRSWFGGGLHSLSALRLHARDSKSEV